MLLCRGLEGNIFGECFPDPRGQLGKKLPVFSAILMLQVMQGDAAVLHLNLQRHQGNHFLQGFAHRLAESILQHVEAVEGAGAQNQQRQQHDGQGNDQTDAEGFGHGDRPAHQRDLLTQGHE
jgi:hypothetical protein